MTVIHLNTGNQVVAHVDIHHLTDRRIARGTVGTVLDVSMTGAFVEFHLRHASGVVRPYRSWVGRDEIRPI
jgi:hypothetical protein